MKPVGPVDAVELFPPLSGELLGVLKGLSVEDWERTTPCAAWSVKDVAAHLLGGNIGRLSSGRDGLRGSSVAISGFSDLLTLIDRQNAEWVQAARRISPPLLIQFLELTDQQLYDYFRSLAPGESGGPAVAWAGDTRSPNWFDIAREYTEKWLHQQHIREATGHPILSGRMWLFPVLDTFVRALPYTYRGVARPDGTSVHLRINGDAGGDWSLVREGGQWRLYAGSALNPTASVRMSADTAWRLFTRGLTAEQAATAVGFEGDRQLGLPALNMVSIMA